MLDRRNFIKCAGAVFMAALGPARSEALDRAEAIYGSAYRFEGDEFGIAIVNERGSILWRHRLPARGHGLACHRPSGRVVVFARRPGLFALAFNTLTEDAPAMFGCGADRHFYGHGVFSSDGELLYATENDFDAARGTIGIYNVRESFSRVGEIESGGVGPHELAILPDGQTLVVANGGIETHPEFGRTKLNLTTMSPSLALIDVKSGSVAETHRLAAEHHQLSMRHLAVGADGRVWYGGQHVGARPGRTQGAIPLVGCLTPGKGFGHLQADHETIEQLRHYVGSVAISADGRTVATTSPRGHVAILWDTGTGRIVSRRNMTDICGAAPSAASELAFSTGTGQLRFGNQPPGQVPEFNWDNHLVRL